jgi:general transcription factor 3C polypeptide 4
MFPGCPPDLVAEAKKLADIIHASLPSIGTLRQNIISESCPACNAEILLESGAHAVCANGHTWGMIQIHQSFPFYIKLSFAFLGRCSVTSFILSTAMVRQCVGCRRKALLPLSCKLYPDAENWLPQPAQSWIVEELLEAAARCLFCGNSFTNVL